jgi:hypothetical protein
LDELKDIVAAASRLNMQLEKKDEIISYLQQQGNLELSFFYLFTFFDFQRNRVSVVQNKENETTVLTTKINEVQKLNANYIEKYAEL